MQRFLVYLAGPIGGCTYHGCTEWREEVAKQLNRDTIHCLSPMRGKDFLCNEKAIDAIDYEHPLATAKGIISRDFNDTTRADVLLVNLMGTEKVSIGTVMEIAWAYDRRIPIVCLIEEKNVHQHKMLMQAVNFVTTDLDEAVAFVRTIIGV